MLSGAFFAVSVAGFGVGVALWCAYGAHLARNRAEIAEANTRRLLAERRAAQIELAELRRELDAARAEAVAACNYVRDLDRGEEVRIVSAVHLGWLRGQASHGEALALAVRVQRRALELILDGAVATDRIARDALEEGRRIINSACEAQKEAL